MLLEMLARPRRRCGSGFAATLGSVLRGHDRGRAVRRVRHAERSRARQRDDRSHRAPHPAAPARRRGPRSLRLARVPAHSATARGSKRTPIEMFAELADVLGDIWTPIREAMADASRAAVHARLGARAQRGSARAQRSDAGARLAVLPAAALAARAAADGDPRVPRPARRDSQAARDHRRQRRRRLLHRRDPPDAACGSSACMPFLDPRRAPRIGSSCARGMLGALTAGRIEDESLRQLARQNLGLLARKVIERVGHTGEHYITSSRREYFKMLALGGGRRRAHRVHRRRQVPGRSGRTSRRSSRAWSPPANYAGQLHRDAAARLHARDQAAVDDRRGARATIRESQGRAPARRARHADRADQPLAVRRRGRQRVHGDPGRDRARSDLARQRPGHHFLDAEDRERHDRVVPSAPRAARSSSPRSPASCCGCRASAPAGSRTGSSTAGCPRRSGTTGSARCSARSGWTGSRTSSRNHSAGIGGNVDARLPARHDAGDRQVLRPAARRPPHHAVDRLAHVRRHARSASRRSRSRSCIGIAIIGLLNFGVSFALALDRRAARSRRVEPPAAAPAGRGHAPVRPQAARVLLSAEGDDGDHERDAAPLIRVARASVPNRAFVDRPDGARRVRCPACAPTRRAVAVATLGLSSGAARMAARDAGGRDARA